jgi:NTE family protein
MEVQNKNCPFCNSTVDKHACDNKIFSIVNALAEEKKRPEVLFNNIENLVFEGGGVKGVAYLGVLKELGEEVIRKAKRVGGTSAGALLALTLGLNLDVKDIEDLLSQPYDGLLDNKLVLAVATNVNSWNPLENWHYSSFRVRDIVLTALARLKVFKSLLSNDPEAAKNKMVEIVANILKYYGSKFGKQYSLFVKFKANDFATMATKWILTALAPKPSKKAARRTPASSMDHMRAHIAADNNIRREVYPPNFKVEEGKKMDYQDLLEAAVTLAIDKINNEQIEERRKYQDILVAKDSEEHKEGYIPPEKIEELRRVFTEKPQDRSFNEFRAFKPGEDIPAESADKLAGEVLHFALAEMIYFLANGQLDAAGNKKDVGFFTGELFTPKIIEYSINLAFKKNNIPNYKEGITFKELAALKDPKTGKPYFRPFYVVAYNTGLLRTEVFSFEHSPDVVVNDAVRASIAIPIFFTPVTIRDGGQPRRIYVDENTSEPAYYMDGGITDNYPIWIFDDLKYCVGNEFPDWKPKKKIFMHNPYTLGFKLMESDRIDPLLEPYFDNTRRKPKRIIERNFMASLGYFVGSLAQGTFSEQQEAQHVHRSDTSRTGYVDSLGISTVTFNLTPAEKLQLIESGKNAVKEYKKRAEKGFNGEGEFYPDRILL